MRTGNAVAGIRRNPVLVDRSAAKYHNQKVRKKITKDEEHDCPGHISEALIHTKETEIEKKNGEFV